MDKKLRINQTKNDNICRTIAIPSIFTDKNEQYNKFIEQVNESNVNG
jgi:hypothetical protein